MNKYILALTALTVGLTACSDEWDDHYQVAERTEGTLWENISAQSDLTHFAKVLDATGFSRTLSSSQVFTVFAPTDDAFSLQECDSLIASYNEQVSQGVKDDYNTVLQEFVENHIALYNYSVNSTTRDSIIMMNGKYQVLDQNGLSGSNYSLTNQLCNNGVLFKLQKQATFLPNIYQYIKTAPGLDSVAAFYKAYEYFVFSANASVPGEIVNGKTQYLDSVTYLTNMLLAMARFATEDSSYMALLPTNEVWKTELEKMQQYYQYDNTVVGRDSLMYLYPRLQILESAYFSNTMNPESKAKTRLVSNLGQMWALGSNYSLYSYPDGGFYWRWNMGKDEFFAGTEAVQCSNGTVYRKSGTWSEHLLDLVVKHDTINQEAESTYTNDSVFTSSTRPISRVYVTKDNPHYNDITGSGYIEIAPLASALPKAMFNIYNVRSNVKYEFAVVTVPPTAGDTLATPLCNNFRVILKWNDADGKQMSQRYPSGSGYFESDSLHVQAIVVDTITFPTSSFGLEKPQVKVEIDGYTNPKLVRAGTHSSTTRIDKFVLTPILE